MFTIGLTGGIGSGKSEVTRKLGKLGAEIVNADLVGHEIYLPDTQGWKEVIEAFGQDILQSNREVDRKKLGAKVFENPEALETLNAITWPKIKAGIKERLDSHRAQGAKVAVFEAALLIEANLNDLADEIWVVTSPEEAVIRRVKERNNFPEEAIRKRIRSQLPNEKRLEYADIAIDNSGDLEMLTTKLNTLWDSHVKNKVASNESG
jgi:dephospho-CoA kinase